MVGARHAVPLRGKIEPGLYRLLEVGWIRSAANHFAFC
jgi:hypothetical protein